MPVSTHNVIIPYNAPLIVLPIPSIWTPVIHKSMPKCVPHLIPTPLLTQATRLHEKHHIKYHTKCILYHHQSSRFNTECKAQLSARSEASRAALKQLNNRGLRYRPSVGYSCRKGQDAVASSKRVAQTRNKFNEREDIQSNAE